MRHKSREAKYNAKSFQHLVFGFWALKLYKSKHSLKVYKMLLL